MKINRNVQKMSVTDKLKLVRQIALSISIIHDIGYWCENIASYTYIQNGNIPFLLGTEFFMAPEVAFGLAKAGTNADNYALANLIFCILTNNILPSPYNGKIMYSSVACQNMLEVKDLVDDDDIDEAWSVFIFDDQDHRSNIDDLYQDADASQPKLQKKLGELDEVIKIWDALDDSLKVLFRKAFKNPLSKEAYMSRPSPLVWVREFDKILNGTSNGQLHHYR